MVRHPFQKLCCILPVSDQRPFLLAASGPTITTFDLRDGTILSKWPRPQSEATEHNGATTADGNDGPPTKRRKVEGQIPVGLSQQTDDGSTEIISEDLKEAQRKAKAEDSHHSSNVSHIVATSDGATVITLTTEDKSINVFRVQPDGSLDLQSQRSMPKKMCAVVLTPDEKGIMVGDKFGDVYLLPLHPSKDFVPKKAERGQAQRSYSPAASELTVHTKGNLEALRQQRKQKVAQPKKEAADFELKLLLGHVSSLTDVTIAEIQDGRRRKQYILSADRDEHIRVSRGLSHGVSQAHLIEAYCLGHKEFVSKLCIPPWSPEYLVAGSAEPSLTVYHFATARVVDKELFQGAVREDIASALNLDDGDRSLERLAVSSIWPINYTVAGNAPAARSPPRLLLVALEGLPILLSYSFDIDCRLKHHQTLTLAGNVLDVGNGPALWDIVVSIDTVHKPGSVKIVRPEETPATEAFETFQLFSNISVDENGSTQLEGRVDGPELRWEKTSLAMLLNDAASHGDMYEAPTQEALKPQATYSTLGETLYGLENLRKKRNSHAQGDEAGEMGDEQPVVPEEAT